MITRIVPKLALLVAFGFSLGACGGGGNDGGSGPPPSISGLALVPGAVYVGANSGTASVTAQMNYTATAAQLSTGTITILDAGGQTLQSASIPITGIQTRTSGEIAVSGQVSTATAGTFTVQFYVTDTAGENSNVLVTTFRVSPFPWTTLAADPTARQGAAVVALGTTFYVIGGAAYTDPPQASLGTVELYDTTTNGWTTGPSLPVPLQLLSAAVVGGKIYVIGGSTAFDACSQATAVYQFDPAVGAWTTLSALPQPLTAVALAVVDTKIYLIGGAQAAQQCPATNYFGNATGSVEVYDTATDTWGSTTPAPTATTGAATSVNGGVITVFGGYGEVGLGVYTPTAVFDTSTQQWQQKASVLGVTDVPSATVVGVAYAFADGFGVAYDAANDVWRPREPPPEPAFKVIGQSAAALDGKIYLFNTYGTFVYNPPDDILQ